MFVVTRHRLYSKHDFIFGRRLFLLCKPEENGNRFVLCSKVFRRDNILIFQIVTVSLILGPFSEGTNSEGALALLSPQLSCTLRSLLSLLPGVHQSSVSLSLSLSSLGVVT
jgi:hypothetical protein